MTACCVSGYRPLRDIRLDECRWPPVLAPAGPWKICDCADGVALGERLAAMAAHDASGIMTPISEAVVIVMKHSAVGKSEDPIEIVCSACRDPDPGSVIEWNDRWRTYLCAECGAVLAEKKP